MSERVVLITGSTDGIGRATARALGAATGAADGSAAASSHAMKVVIHGRSKTKVDAAIEQLSGELPGASFEGVSFDLGSQSAIRSGAARILERLPQLHVLVNNAGIFASERTITEDGVELTYAVNYLAGFLLVELLAERLEASAEAAGIPSRVINVSSIAHTRGRIHADRTMADAWTGYAAYAQSKLAQVMHTISLSERHDPSKLVAYSVHPGVISTKLLRQGFGPVAGGSVEAGAKTSIRLAGELEVIEPSGTYFSDGTPMRPADSALDKPARDALWATSLKTVKLGPTD